MESNVIDKVWKAYEVLLQWEVDEAAEVDGTTYNPEAKSACEALFEARMLLQEALRNLRNCDVGTAEEQYTRHDMYCGMQPTCKKCLREDAASMCVECFAKWAQKPYEEGERKEGEGDGK